MLYLWRIFRNGHHPEPSPAARDDETAITEFLFKATR
jgi:hypothetical protein